MPKHKKSFNPPINNSPKVLLSKIVVDSLLDVMVDGKEYGSIIDKTSKNADLVPELRRALNEIEQIRKKPCICYIANVIKPKLGFDIQSLDDLPFNEMIRMVDKKHQDIDVIIVTPGGSMQQVFQFVKSLRARFKTVEFILPYMCMSAGTLWVLSGDKIWMDEMSYIGPIDPQIRLADGSWVPAQSILILLEYIKEQGEEYIKKGQNPPWNLIRLLDNIDGRIIGDTLTQSGYSIKMATEFLENYKFKSWEKHSTTGKEVTPQEKHDRAKKIAEFLCSHKEWQSHGHGITREVAINNVKLDINKLESIPGLSRAVRRFWALLYWLFDRSLVYKMFISQDYILVRNAPLKEGSEAK